MQIDKFLEYEITAGFEHIDLFAKLAKLHYAHELFEPFDDKDFALINRLRAIIREIMRSASASPHLKRHVSDRKVAEIAGLAYYSGILDEQSPVHLYDACAGTGILAHLISRMRGEHWRTAADCLELQPEYATGFAHLRDKLALGNPGLHFVQGPVHTSSLTTNGDKATYVLGKHMCGDTVSDVIALVEKSPPVSAALLTCCHGKSLRIPENARLAGVEDFEWRLLTRFADWTSSPNFTQSTIGRVAMRLMDTLRIIGLSSDITVREVVDPKVSVKNQAVIFRRTANYT